jgi:hypothetical protein
VSIEKTADGTYVLPVPVKKITEYIILSYRLGDDLSAKILMACVLKKLLQNVPLEKVYSHGG